MKPITCPQCETRIIHLVQEEEQRPVATFSCGGCDIEFDINHEKGEVIEIRQLPKRHRKLSARTKKMLQEVTELYENMSDEEFKARLEKAGFEVVEGETGIVFSDENEGGDAE